MNNKHLLLLFCFFLSLSSFAQEKEKMTREEKDEKNQARTTRINDKNDYAIFHRQLLGLKEYQDERKKIPALSKSAKTPVKVIVGIDSLDEADEAASKTLVGFIRQDIGDNSTTMYDVTYDRAQKKIVSVKRTAEAIEADKDKDEDATPAKPASKTAVHKKNKDDDDDDDPEDKPIKSKKSKDDDD
jgi:hypothetical protein